MEVDQAHQLTGQSQREKSWFCTKLEMRDRALQEDRTKSHQEIEELRRICSTQAERARQLRIDELSSQEEESESVVNQVMVQIQELQDKINSLSDARKWFHLETASSSGLSHVPSQPMSIPSPGGLISSDSCLQPDTRNSFGYIRTRF